MDVKEAVQAAKQHVAEIFADESIVDIGLEEVELDEVNGVWLITIGFTRIWERPGGIIRALGGDTQRVFKIVRIDDDSGCVQSVKHRNVAGDR